MALPLGERLLTKRIVTRIEETKHGVEVDVLDASTQQTERWQAERCIVALPVFVATRVVKNPPTLLQAAAQRTRYAPWLVANIHIDKPLIDQGGAAPSWDNVLYGTAGLGYVNAKHQSLQSVPAATVLTYYRALGDMKDGRKLLLERSWGSCRDEILAELSVAHPDLATKATKIDITRYGHAMAIPAPVISGKNGLQPSYLLPKQLLKKEQKTASTNRLSFAHSDWAGYSVFEEAFAMGHAAGNIK
jgi:monoamine oxidase